MNYHELFDGDGNGDGDDDGDDDDGDDGDDGGDTKPTLWSVLGSLEQTKDKPPRWQPDNDGWLWDYGVEQGCDGNVCQ